MGSRGVRVTSGEPSDRLSRRGFLAGGAAAVLGAGGLPLTGGEVPAASSAPAVGTDIVGGIDRSVIWEGRAGGTTWFHPRACVIPSGARPTAFMTLQSISGSDVFGPVHWSESADVGRTWSAPQPIDGMGRHPSRNGLSEGVCDVVPEYHPPTKTVLAIGHNVYYNAKGALANPQLERFPVYVVRSSKGTFSKPEKLAWDDPRGAAIYTCGCAQRLVLEDGDILIPLAYAPSGSTPRAILTALCGFDGEKVVVKRVGNSMTNRVRRGLLEPNLARFKGRFYITIRAEDDRGYVSCSGDGLDWEAQRPWCWDDGEPLVMSTTQQHWLAHSDALFLTYTRRAPENINVMRWRAPIYMAEVDVRTLRLIRSSERVVFPLVGDGIRDAQRVPSMGNFHTTAASGDESWVTVGETCPAEKYSGNTLLARVLWRRPNRNAPSA